MDESIKILLALITSFIITFFAMPAIIKVANFKQLYDTPNAIK